MHGLLAQVDGQRSLLIGFWTVIVPSSTSLEEVLPYGTCRYETRVSDMSYESEPVLATVAELKPRMKNITITFKVVQLGTPREVTSREDGANHRVLDAVVGDSTGTVQMPLWDSTIESVEVGKSYKLTNGYTGLFRGSLRLNVGRYGQLAEAEAPIDDVNMDVDMSAEEHEDTRRPRRSYGGGYGGGRSGGYGSEGGYGRDDYYGDQRGRGRRDDYGRRGRRR